MDNLISIILAAGQGTRMKSDLPKVLHKLGDKTIIEYSVETVEQLGVERIMAIVGHGKKLVQDVLGDRVEYVTQEKQLGTGHAVQQAEKLLADHDGYILVSNGDMPFLAPEMFTGLYRACQKQGAVAALLTVETDEYQDWGRIVRSEDGNVREIIEAKDASSDVFDLKEKNVGVYCFKARDLFKALKEIKAENKQGEYYITDVIKIMNNQGLRVVSVATSDFDNIVGINSREDLAKAREIIKNRS